MIGARHPRRRSSIAYNGATVIRDSSASLRATWAGAIEQAALRRSRHRDDHDSNRRRSLPRSLRRLRHLRPPRSLQARLPGPLRPAASRTGIRRHRLFRRRSAASGKRHGPGAGNFSARRCSRACPAPPPWATRATPPPATPRSSTPSPSSSIATRASWRWRHNGNLTNAGQPAPHPRTSRLDLSDHQRHRSHRASGGPQLRAQSAGRAGRRPQSSGRRLFAAGSHPR